MDGGGEQEEEGDEERLSCYRWWGEGKVVWDGMKCEGLCYGCWGVGGRSVVGDGMGGAKEGRGGRNTLAYL